jgi:acyl dehydratase
MADQDCGPGAIRGGDLGHRTVATTFEVTPRRIQAFAAGIRDHNPVYFDDTRTDGLVGHPGLAFSFQWNSRRTPDRQPNPRSARYGVHAWTDLRLERPFLEGDVITSQGANAGFEQVRPGVLTLSRYTMTDSSGELVADLDIGSIVRGATLEGPHAPPELTPLPEVEPAGEPIWERDIEIPPDAAHAFTECADIYNPIHTERRIALAAGLPDIILHGSATQAIAISALVDGSLDGDPARVRRFYAQNRAMVLMDTRITVRCLGEHQLDDGTVAFAFDVLTEDGAPALARGVLVATM